jgi:hypothetical protein
MKNSTTTSQDTPKRKRGRPKKLTGEAANNAITPEDIENLGDIPLDEEEKAMVDKLVRKKTKQENRKKYYVDNGRMTDLIMQYHSDDNLGDELAIYLYNIANRISFMPNFINYTWKEEMIGDGIEKEFKALKNKKFDPTKGKAFSYFSMIVYNAFCNRIKKELKEKEVIREYQEQQYNLLMPEQHGKIITSNDGDEVDE